MQRRAAISRISLIGGGLLLVFSGTKVYQRYKSPHFQSLKEKGALLAALAETILPGTDSPGAGEAGGGDFIGKMVRDCAARKTENTFFNGLEVLAGRARSRYGKDFGQCSLPERTALLAECEQEGSVHAGKVG